MNRQLDFNETWSIHGHIIYSKKFLLKPRIWARRYRHFCETMRCVVRRLAIDAATFFKLAFNIFPMSRIAWISCARACEIKKLFAFIDNYYKQILLINTEHYGFFIYKGYFDIKITCFDRQKSLIIKMSHPILLINFINKFRVRTFSKSI